MGDADPFTLLADADLERAVRAAALTQAKLDALRMEFGQNSII